MKKIQFKWFNVPNPPEDFMDDLSREGALGWRFVHGVGTPTGLRFILERITDEEVDDTDVEAYEKAKKEAALVAQFGPGGRIAVKQPGPNDTVSLR